MNLIRAAILTAALLAPSLAVAQAPVNPCVAAYNATTGAFSCIPVGQTSPNITTINPLPVGGVANAAAPTFVEGRPGYLSFDLSGNLRTAATVTPSGTQDTNILQWGSVAVLAGNGATGTGSPRVTIANDNTVPTGWPSSANQTATQAPVAPATATATKSDLVGCQATSAAINPTTGQQAAIDCDLNNNLLVSSGGAPNLTTAQVTVTTSSTSVVAARALRRSVTITNITGTQQVYCSGTTATTGNGQLIPAVVGASWNVSTTAAINCIAISSSQTVSTSETF